MFYQNNMFLNTADFVICPSNFVFSHYQKQFITKIKQVPHIDYTNTRNRPRRQEIDKFINLGIIHDYSEYKGEEIYNILKHSFQNIEIDNKIVKFITLGKETEYYHEDEYFQLIKKHKIHALLYLNKYGETWCYSISKALKTGLPIIYNNIGAFKERIKPNNYYKILFEDEKSISTFIMTKYNPEIYEKIKNFIKNIIEFHNTQEIKIYNDQKINLAKKTNLFYDSLYGNFKVQDLIDLYAIYFPQFHPIPQNSKNFYKGYTDFENLKMYKKKNQYGDCIMPKQSDYNLLLPDFVKDQVETAKKYNFKGFGCYYYWFSKSDDKDNMIMRKGVDKLFEVDDDDFKIFFIWANEDWNNESLGNTNKIMNEYTDIEFHKNIINLIPYFKNPKYLKEDNKPVLFICHPWIFKENQLENFRKILNQKCKLEGFNGCKVVTNNIEESNDSFKKYSLQPNYKKYKSMEIDYDKFYSDETYNPDTIQTFFFNFNNHPRMFKPDRMNVARKFKNLDEKHYEKHFFKSLEHYSFKNKGIDRIYLFNSWNEWGEQMAIEPSKEKGTYYLDLINSWYSKPLSL